jgi:hypothetical protein
MLIISKSYGHALAKFQTRLAMLQNKIPRYAGHFYGLLRELLADCIRAVARFGGRRRRGRDSNPRYPFEVYTLSRRALSTTQTPLRLNYFLLFQINIPINRFIKQLSSIGQTTILVLFCKMYYKRNSSFCRFHLPTIMLQ